MATLPHVAHSTSRQRGLHLATLLALLLMLTAYALHHMHDSLWYDEWRSIYNVGGAELGPFSPAQIWERIITENPWQAPNFYFILAGWGAAVGWSELAGRVLPMLFGLLSIAALYRLGSDLWSRRIGLYAALLLGLSAFYLHFLHELRAYTLVVLLTVVLIDTYWRLVYAGGGWKAACLFVLCAAALPYTHYFAVTTVFALALYHLLFAPKRRGWWKIPALLVVALVAFLPWLVVVLKAVSMAANDARRFQTFTPLELLTLLATMFANNSPALLGLFVLYSLFRRSRALLYVGTLLVGGFALMIGLDQFVHILVAHKYAMHLLPALSLIAASGLHAIARRGLNASLLLGLWAAACLWSVNNPAYQDMILPNVWYFSWIEARATLDGRDQSGDTALVLLPDPSLLAKNYQPLLAHYFYGLSAAPALIAPSPAMTDAHYNDLAEDAFSGAQRLWLIYDQQRRPWRVGPLQETVLPEHGFAACGTLDAPAPLSVSLFAHQPDADSQPSARYDQIAVYNLGSAQQVIDGRLSVVLGFETALDYSPYSFAIHVYDSAGQLAMQSDGGVPAEAFACRAFDLGVGGLASGDYTLNLLLYNWETGARLPTDTGAEVTRLGAFVVGS
jgi:hypothetical protein